MTGSADTSALLESAGPWPFVTWRLVAVPSGPPVEWRSRHHRKGLPHKPAPLPTVLTHAAWLPHLLNWWIGVIFALGALLFTLGSLFVLLPGLAAATPAQTANAVFFAGSIPFTTAAYLQLYQAANARVLEGDSEPETRQLFGWRPQDIGWLSCATQFAGTLFFNATTFDAMIPGLDWLQQDLGIWIPNALGSILFLVSGYLAFAEECHGYFAWRPGGLSWWVTFINLIGCVAFMASAVFAFVPREPFVFDAAEVSVSLTLVGALAFLVGSLLMLPETADPPA